jgi:hypothetical protein
MWRGPNFIKVEALIHGDVFLHTAGPMIIIDRSSLAEIFKAGEHIPALVEESSGEKIEFTADELKDIRVVLERMYRGDASAIILAQVMSEELSKFASPDIDIQLVETQKVANIVYAQFPMPPGPLHISPDPALIMLTIITAIAHYQRPLDTWF